MAERLKDIFFAPAFLKKLATGLRQVYPRFDQNIFFNSINDGAWEARELLERMHHIAACLQQMLPQPYSRALEILQRVAPQFQGFEALVFPDYVEQYGLHDWDLSLPALGFFTQFGSSEFAVRPFLREDPERVMAYMKQWAEDANPLVRRLASEGCRPRLPWAMALPAFKKDPRPILPILEKLKDDEAETVRRSVANNLNDISKDHPELMLEICERWYGRSERTDWIVKHACRSLLKAKHKSALRLFGFGEARQVRVNNLKLAKKRIAIGEELYFLFDLKVSGEKECKVRAEYTIDFLKAHGGTSTKVFQLTEKSYAPGVYAMSRRYSTADKTTRKHYPGKHRLAIVVNGKEQAEVWFELLIRQSRKQTQKAKRLKE